MTDRQESAQPARERETHHEKDDRRRPRRRNRDRRTVFRCRPAQAESFIGCGYGAGIATSVTSCEFAQNVRYAWFHQPGRIIEAYSPVTGQYYSMYCDPNYTARMDTGRVYNSVHCEGGNNAVVVIW